MALLDEIRAACAEVAAQAQFVRIRDDAIPAYAHRLHCDRAVAASDPEVVPLHTPREQLAGFVLALDAVNFGSGWFPTLRKRPGRSGYFTIALALREQFDSEPERFAAPALWELDDGWFASISGQDPDHELVGLYGSALRELGERTCADHGGSFAALLDTAECSAERLVELLARWPGFADTSSFRGGEVPLFKRAQIAAADLAGAGVLEAGDLQRLTMFADNLVPHVLHLDGVLDYEPALTDRIDAGELLEHGSAEEVEIRACALHAVELMVAAEDQLTAAAADAQLWNRGGGARYKQRPRHRARCTAY